MFVRCRFMLALVYSVIYAEPATPSPLQTMLEVGINR
jgi:hypothetical protein